MPNFSSPIRIDLPRGNVLMTPSVRISVDQPKTFHGHSSSSNQNSDDHNNGENKKSTCMCSPTSHAGSFRCSMHRSYKSNMNNNIGNKSTDRRALCQLQRLYTRRFAMVNSLAKTGSVEGALAKRKLIRPSSHKLRWCGEFQPRPSRLSVMCKADQDSE
ncbi:hypothetical protein QVD17_25551 [Tagetes erecta]|uniref:Uncharacterized protein n=1 Tax=Tagetes erecta TaxID=13708 RepID=A0AAD8KGG1_TARER|nr:hypothetical protein QVD17_25551 [Tagetes erecta]